MRGEYIDFISAYCDSWCERCPLTARCSDFAVKCALPMCDDDLGEAIELAIGPARVPGARPQESIEERMAEALDGYAPTEKELAEIGDEIDARRARVRRHPLSEMSRDYAVAGDRWLDSASGAVVANADALAVVQWDLHLIPVKISRALSGYDEHPQGAPFEAEAVQSDWNGSAKVALISIERSERAWRELAEERHCEAATALADILAKLRHRMIVEFPRAMAFRRPGFDAA
jgi:hypothetical protein